MICKDVKNLYSGLKQREGKLLKSQAIVQQKLDEEYSTYTNEELIETLEKDKLSITERLRNIQREISTLENNFKFLNSNEGGN